VNKAVAEFLVGLTVLLGLLGVSFLLMRFGEISGVARDAYPVYLEMPDASGLNRASRAMLNGVPIGTIDDLKTTADPRGGVIVTILVDKGFRIPRDVEVSLDRGLVGEATLSFRTKPLVPGAADPGVLGEGETLRATAKGMMDEIAAMLEEKLSGFAGAAEDFKKLSESFMRAGDRLYEALSPRTPDEVDRGEAAANLMSTVARFDLAVRDAREWVGDAGVRTDVKASAAKFRALLDEGAAAVEAWTKAAETLSTRADRLGDDAGAAMREFSAAARSLNETVLEVQSLAAKINRGEGTAGMFVNNPDLYRSLNDPAVRLERALAEAQLLIEKYRKEGIPLRF
jgi:phospholipid/cholesterol/gamma-HCH transport system substrate-binding protein